VLQLVTQSAVSPNADNHFFCQKKRLACVEAELKVSIILHCPLRKTIGDELSDVVHDERLGGIAVEEALGSFGVSLAHARQFDDPEMGRRSVRLVGRNVDRWMEHRSIA
jgi:hypothetical protein